VELYKDWVLVADELLVVGEDVLVRCVFVLGGDEFGELLGRYFAHVSICRCRHHNNCHSRWHRSEQSISMLLHAKPNKA
jgi:hypothetical protein